MYTEKCQHRETMSENSTGLFVHDEAKLNADLVPIEKIKKLTFDK